MATKQQDNGQILLDRFLEGKKAEQASSYSSADFFELFTAENILKKEALTYDELENGLVGAGGDGGLDAVYFLVDGKIVNEESEAKDFKKSPRFEIFFIQAKQTPSFGEGSIDKFISVTTNLFDLSKSIDDFKALYNDDIREKFDSFRKLYLDLVNKHPTVVVKYVYATRGTTSAIHPNVKTRVAELSAALERQIPGAEFSLEFLGAAELLSLARQRPPEALSLPVTEILSSGSGGYVALSRLIDFNAFLRGEDGKPHGHIFDDNVRAYQGAVEVNRAIRETLESDNDEDFWWLNNGVTILAQKASLASRKMITITDPQIINGLQTSSEIIAFFDDNEGHSVERHVMVKIVESTSSATRDHVIKATNSQTSVLPSSLRATDAVQRSIEEALGHANLYYDRQKNFYKNEGRPLDRIVGISEMAQTVMSVVLQRPNDARARPSSLIKQEQTYGQIFDDRYPIQLYVVAGEMKKAVDRHLREQTELSSADRNNLVFHTLTRLAVLLTKSAVPTAEQVSAIELSSLTQAKINQALAEILPSYKENGNDGRAAKGSEFASAVKALPLPTASGYQLPQPSLFGG